MDPINEAYQQTINEGSGSLKKNEPVILQVKVQGIGYSDFEDQAKTARQIDGYIGIVTSVAVENNKSNKDENYYNVYFGNNIMLDAVSGIHLIKVK